MNLEQAFLQAIIESHEDDTPRLVYADWLDENGQPELAEYIRLEVWLAGGAIHDAEELGEELERSRSLLHEHRSHWVRPFPGDEAERWQFRRGFVDEMHPVDPGSFLRHAEEFCRRHPVRRISFGALTSWMGRRRTPLVCEELAESPPLRRLPEVEFNFSFDTVSDADLRAFSCVPRLLGTITSLGALETHTTEAGWESVLSSPDLGRLRGLHLHNSTFEGGARLGRLVSESPSLRGLTHLGLSKVLFGYSGTEALATHAKWGGLRWLELEHCELGDRAAAALAAMPQLRGIEYLSLQDNEIGDAGAIALANSSHLESLGRLYLRRTGIGPAGARALLESPNLPCLQLLDLGGCRITPADVNRLPTRPGLTVRYE